MREIKQHYLWIMSLTNRPNTDPPVDNIFFTFTPVVKTPVVCVKTDLRGQKQLPVPIFFCPFS